MCDFPLKFIGLYPMQRPLFVFKVWALVNVGDESSAVWFEDFRVLAQGWQIHLYGDNRAEFMLAPNRGFTFYFLPGSVAQATS